MSPNTLTSILFLLFLSSATVPLTAETFNCDPSDHQTLLRIKAEFRNPAALSSWTPTTNCCTWKGVLCESSGKTLGLTISDATFSSPIAPSIGSLPVLSYLTLQNLPHLTGPIPASLANLTYLKTLTIRNTALSGQIPAFLANMQGQLGDIDLSYNQLSGPIPSFLSSNTMKFMYSLNLGHNKLSGTIPATLYAGSITNPNLYLSNNGLYGVIPPALGKVDFSIIDLSHNRLVGDASFLFGASKRTTNIVLSWNMFSFVMTRIGLSPYLQELDLSHNTIRGNIPRSIARLKSLKKLDVSYNGLCGRIPSGQFSSASYVQNKCLCGPPLGGCSV